MPAAACQDHPSTLQAQGEPASPGATSATIAGMTKLLPHERGERHKEESPRRSMSLAQHVSATEGVDREPEASWALDPDRASLAPLGRRLSLTLSYDPTPVGAQPSEKLQSVGAYEVSQSKRIAQIATGVVSCVLASGIVFGFAALKSVLVEEHVYRDLCTEQELIDHVQVCYLQDVRLNLAFTIASVTTNVSALIVGAILDRYGPRLCGLVGAVSMLFGNLSMAFATELPFDGYIIGHFLLALGGTFIFVPSFQLANAFPKWQGFVLALVTGAFDASAAIFLLFRVMYYSTNGAIGVKAFFLAYLVVPVCIAMCQLTFMPSQSYQTRLELHDTAEEAKDPAQDIHDSDEELDSETEVRRIRSQRVDVRKRTIAEIDDLLGTARERHEHDNKEDEKRVISGVWGALHGLPASKQIQTPWFILITLLTILQMARMNFFIATIWSQYQYLLDSRSMATRVNDFFDIALPIGGIAAVPFVGVLLDNTSTAVVLGLLVILSTTFGVLGVLPYLWAGYANVILFVLFRPLYYSAMSDYAAKVFGFATFGTVYGTIICISGLTTFSQFPLQAITHDKFVDNPVPVNLTLTLLGLLIGSALVAFVAVRGPAVQQELADEDERRSLLPRPSVQNLRFSAASPLLTTVPEAGEEGPNHTHSISTLSSIYDSD